MSEKIEQAKEAIILDIENAEIDQKAIDFVKGTELFQSLVASVGSEIAEQSIRKGSRAILDGVVLQK